MPETFNCKCIKCSNSFVSEDTADFDGEGFCEPCKLLNKEIAAKVDAQLAAKRANKPTVELINPYVENRKKNKSVVHYFSKGGFIS